MMSGLARPSKHLAFTLHAHAEETPSLMGDEPKSEPRAVVAEGAGVALAVNFSGSLFNPLVRRSPSSPRRRLFRPHMSPYAVLRSSQAAFCSFLVCSVLLVAFVRSDEAAAAEWERVPRAVHLVPLSGFVAVFFNNALESYFRAGACLWSFVWSFVVLVLLCCNWRTSQHAPVFFSSSSSLTAHLPQERRRAATRR